MVKSTTFPWAIWSVPTFVFVYSFAICWLQLLCFVWGDTAYWRVAPFFGAHHSLPHVDGRNEATVDGGYGTLQDDLEANADAVVRSGELSQSRDVTPNGAMADNTSTLEGSFRLVGNSYQPSLATTNAAYGTPREDLMGSVRSHLIPPTTRTGISGPSVDRDRFQTPPSHIGQSLLALRSPALSEMGRTSSQASTGLASLGQSGSFRSLEEADAGLFLEEDVEDSSQSHADEQKSFGGV